MRNEVESAFGGQKQSGKTWIIVLIVIILLAIIGYFAWDYFSAEGDDEDDRDKKAAKGCEIVDEDGWVGIDSNVAVDSENNPHICYFDQGNKKLKYARKISEQWEYETVDKEGNNGEECGIALDKNNIVHISYNDTTSGSLRYARGVFGDWETKKIFTAKNDFHITSTSIKLDSQQNPHIVFDISTEGEGQYSEGKLQYALFDGSDWKFEIINDNGEDAYLAIDSNDRPHISFIAEDPDIIDNKMDHDEDQEPDDNIKGVEDDKDEDNDKDNNNNEKSDKELKDQKKLNYATKTGGQWQVDIVDQDCLAGGDTGIAVDSKNHPHIAYLDYGNKAKKYAYWDGTSWQTEILFQDNVNGEGIKIAVDKDDNSRIVYNNGKIETLMLASWDGNAWIKKELDAMGNPGIVIDSLNRTHVSYGHCVEDKNKQFADIMQETGEKEIEILKYCLIE